MKYASVVFGAAAAGMLLALPAIGIGFAIDDQILIAVIEGWYPELGQPFNVYASFGDLPNLPWWTSADFLLAFWRPLASALLRLDHGLFGRHAFAYHLHSLLWLAALVAACGLLYSRLPRRRIAVLALLIFVLDESHALTSGVICNRHAVVSLVPAVLGLLAHMRWRERGWLPGLPLSVVGFALGLVAGETAVAILGYAFCYELFAASGPATGWRRRLAGITPLLLLTGIYLAWYEAAGFGVSTTVYYLSPLHHPLATAGEIARRLLVLLASTLVGLPAELWVFANLYHGQMAAGLVGVLGVGGWLWLCRSRVRAATGRELDWLVPGAFAAMLPAALGAPHDRLLLAPMIGFSVLLGFFLDTAWRECRRRTAPTPWRRLAAGGLLAAGVLIHLVSPLPKRLLGLYGISRMERGYTEIAAQLPAGSPDQGERQLIVVNSPDMGVVLRVPLIRDLDGGHVADSWHVLATAPCDYRLRRTGRRTLVLEAIDATMLRTFGERVVVSAEDLLTPGEIVTGELFQVEVLATDGRGPTRLAFHFHRDLDDPELVFMAWRAGRLERLALPPAEGQLTLEWSPGPLNMLAPTG